MTPRPGRRAPKSKLAKLDPEEGNKLDAVKQRAQEFIDTRQDALQCAKAREFAGVQ